MPKKVDITGQKFGFLTAIRKSQFRTTDNRSVIWLCGCDCGHYRLIPLFMLKRPYPHACGRCRLNWRKHTDLIGKQFGRLTVIRNDTQESEKGRRFWLCRCECGEEKRVRNDELTRGRVRSCGCLCREVSRERSKNLRREKGRFQKIPYPEMTVDKLPK